MPPKKRKLGNEGASPTKRARGATDDLSLLWRTGGGDDALPLLSGQASSNNSVAPTAYPSVLSGALLGLGATLNMPALNQPFFGTAPVPLTGNQQPAAPPGTQNLNATNQFGVGFFNLVGADEARSQPPLAHSQPPLAHSQPPQTEDANEDAADIDNGLDYDDADFDDAPVDAGKAPADKDAKASSSRSMRSRFPIIAWADEFRKYFLQEVLRLDGRGDALDLTECPQCRKKGVPEYRCLDCRGAELCRGCIVKWHTYNPLHGIQRWNGQFYDYINPQDLGLDIQLCHRPGEACKMRSLGTVKNFTIIHTNGVRVVRMYFCKCSLAGHVPAYVQLLRWRLWPATCYSPESATTFEALDLFHRLSLFGKLNGYDFVRAIEAATDGACIRGVADVRQRFMTCIRQFRHIFMFKRAGRGHEPGGIEGTPGGACAVVCPACPNYELNLPRDWATRPFQWMYRVIVSLDANFRLSNRLTRSKNSTDPNLTEGKAYMVPETDYLAHIKETEKDVVDVPSSCSRFGAVEMANRKGGALGLRTTGIAGCSCARHEHILPQGIATLRRGERYVTMDYIFGCALGFLRCASVAASYDIACQWNVNLLKRMSRVPSGHALSAGAAKFSEWMSESGGSQWLWSKVKFAVPKFHLYAHKVACQVKWSFLWLVGAAATDGEGCERIWSGANPAASSLREMGPGSMQDTMDDMCGAWNWQKTCGIADLLKERMVRALKEAKEQCVIHTQLTEAIRADDKDKLDATEKRVGDWEWDNTRPSPYFLEKERVTVAQVKLQTAQAQGSSLQNASDLRTPAAEGGAKPGAGEKAPPVEDDEGEEKTQDLAQFILRGLDIEVEQARLATNASEDDVGTTKQETTKTQALNNLVRMIRKFREDQERLMPRTYASLTSDEREPDRRSAVKAKLHLPSDPPRRMSKETASSSAAREMEAQLRWASMEDALENLRHQLRLRGCLYRHKRRQIRGQRSSTRSLTAQQAVNANVKKAAEAYKRHRVAYLALKGEGDWTAQMRELEASDCRGLGDGLIKEMEKAQGDKARDFLAERGGKKRSGDTTRKIPWIWLAAGESGLNITDQLLVEWCKSRARAQRWVEEVRLLDEEMRRILAFNESIALIWDGRREPTETMVLDEVNKAWGADKGWADGVRAYACKQAWIRRAQAWKWKSDLAVVRLEATTFLSTHTEDGMCLASIDGFMEGFETMTLTAAGKELDEAEEFSDDDC